MASFSPLPAHITIKAYRSLQAGIGTPDKGNDFGLDVEDETGSEIALRFCPKRASFLKVLNLKRAWPKNGNYSAIIDQPAAFIT